MTLDEFKEQFDLLVSTFQVSKPEEKAKVYFKFLEKIPNKAFCQIVDTWIKTQPRFPSISDLLAQYLSQGPAIQSKQECKVCDGYGRIKIGYKIYRAWCEHENMLSKSIKQAKTFMRESELIGQRMELEELYGANMTKKRYPELYK